MMHFGRACELSDPFYFRSVRSDKLHMVLAHLILDGLNCLVIVLMHSSRRILHQVSSEAGFDRINCGALHAVVVGEADCIDMCDVAGFQHVSQSTHGDGGIREGRSKSRIHLDSRILSLFDNVMAFGHVELGDEIASLGALNTVDRPEPDLLSLVGIVRIWDSEDGFERFVVRRRMI